MNGSAINSIVGSLFNFLHPQLAGISSLPDSETSQFSNKQLLIVDDNNDILDFIQINLKSLYNLTFARNGAEALDIIQSSKPHLVISDVMMPIMDGFELCQNIKTNRATSHIPVILLTAKALDMHKTQGMNKGADIYITKPFDIAYLKSCIDAIFKRQQQFAQYIQTRMSIMPQGDSLPENNADNVFLKKVMAIIEQNIADPQLSVDFLSEQMAFSSTHLYRKLKEITGHSTKEIIINYRMQKAAYMLENNEGNIAEIMYATGFSSPSSFSKAFKAKFGVPPGAYTKSRQ